MECVPNFSEGRDQAVIDKITGEIEKVSGVSLLDVDPGADTNRTVVTFIGDPDAVVDAAFAAVKKAAAVIDMSEHKGEHPRHGAVDVCPFVPVSGVTMDDCVALSKRLGKRVGEDIEIPVYLYEFSARKEEWRSLANIRTGEYEALPDKLGTEEWRPDYGPNEWNDLVARTGVLTTGAREFLIAYNIDLNTRDKKLANDIALSIREGGRNKRGPDGRFVRDENGKPVKEPGLLKAVRAIGWYIDDYGIAQISANIINYKTTPIWKVFETCVEEARKRGLRVTGSEIVGLVPKESLLQCGRHSLVKQDRCPGVPEEELVHIAVKSLGLDDLEPFDAAEKIVEYRIPGDAPLANMTVKGFIQEVSMPSQAPGGGSVAALAGALGAALTSMIPNLTKPKRYVKKRSDEEYEVLWGAGEKAQEIQAALIRAVDEDTKAFNKVIAGMRMSKDTPEEKEARKKAIQGGYKHAALVPYRTMELCFDIFDLAGTVGKRGLAASITDVGVAAMMANAGVKGAALNVKINLGEIDDKEFVEKMGSELQDYMDRADKKTGEIMALVEEKMG